MAVNNNRRHYSDKNSNSTKSVITKVPLVLLSMILSGLLLLTVSAYFLLKSESPLLLSRVAALICLYACAVIGGLISAGLFKGQRAYLCAILSSLAFTAIILIMKAFVPRSDASPTLPASILMHSAVIILASAGVLAYQKTKAQTNGRHRKRR